jgi:hypothetical protein
MKTLLNENTVSVDPDSVDIIYKDSIQEYSNSDTPSYRIVFVRPNLKDPFIINYKEDEKTRNEDFDKLTNVKQSF